MKTLSLLSLLLTLTQASPSLAQYSDWKHTGSVYVLTTPDGANLPAGKVAENFPLLVRLHKDFFDFTQANVDGADLRFSTAEGTPLAYQIEEWNSKSGIASIWVRVPRITGNARQELKLHWGKADAKSESNGNAVFNDSNGFLSVWHMSNPVTDEVGTLQSQDTGTTPVAGVVGKARHFPGQKGIFGGDKIPNYPSGSRSHSTGVWFRAEKPNGSVIAWGNEQAQGKVVMNFRSPPHVSMDCYFSNGNVTGKSRLTSGEWVHVTHTYEKGDSRLYINGILDSVSTSNSSPLNIRSPARLWIGGWYHNYNFVGDIDEVQISKVARSADWIKLQYENQKPLQTLVGPLVSRGHDFSVAHDNVTINESNSIDLSIRATGAEKIYWYEKRGQIEKRIATDRLHYQFDAGRVDGDQTVMVRVEAIYPKETQSKTITIKIREQIPDPDFAISVNSQKPWDGRSRIKVCPVFKEGTRGNTPMHITYEFDGMAVISEKDTDECMSLLRAFKSGPLKVTLKIDNGGKVVEKSVIIPVQLPAQDAWAERTPGKDEKPESGQFYARNDRNEGILHYNGTLTTPADEVYLKLLADDKLVTTTQQKLTADRTYKLSAKLKPGLIHYSVEFGSITGGKEQPLATVKNLVCGDAYLINGQSNAVATDFGKDNPQYQSEWVRTYGTMSGNVKSFTGWGNAIHRNRDREKFQIGYWGMELGRRILETHKIPVCIINGAVGGTRIDQHQRNMADPEDLSTIYGRLLWRVRQAKLTHGIRGIIWHQGENDQGADGPSGGYGYETYRRNFHELAASWKQDYPNVQRFYVYQIWPKACSMGVNGSDNKLREVQRNLPSDFSQLSIMSTLGIDPPGGCHFPAAGYSEFARLLFPLMERDHYGKVPQVSITPPNLLKAAFADTKKQEIVLEFDQPIQWSPTLVGQFYLDGQKGKIASGSVNGTRLTLRLNSNSEVKTITYLDSASWSQKTLLVGTNGIAALTFCEVPIQLK